MPREYSRAQRVGEQMRRELAVLIQRELKDPRIGLVTLSEVRVNHDLSHARVYVTVLDGDQDRDATVAALNHAAAFLRRELAHRIRLRTMPALRFVYDESVERGARLEALIEASVSADRGRG